MFLRTLFSLNAAATTSSRAFLSGSAIAGNKFADRERAFEESFVRKHEQEALARLRAQINSKASPEEVAKSLNELEKAITADDVPVPDASHHVTSAELLNFRKEFLNKVRHLEDEVAELKYALSKK